MSKLGRLRPPKMVTCHPSWRTNWRAPMKKLIGSALTMTQSASKINNAVAVKPVVKYQGLRSLPWGVRRSLLRRIPVSGAPTSLGRRPRHFLRADLGQAHPPHPLLAAATVGPVPVAQHIVRRPKAGLV
jgi:hypothetical protein